jgi:AcrR family transcriptional regulator
VLRGRVEAHLVPVRVVQVRQNPADRRVVHPGVWLAERGEPGREVLDRFLRRDADGEVVETCRRFGAGRVEAQRELWPAVRVAHRNAHQLAVLDELDRGTVTAHQLFVRDGYQATTLTAVADAAGVAHRTVYVRFGTKAALLKRVVDVALVGDLAPVDVVSREWYRTATTAPSLDARIAAFAKGSARLTGSAADVIAVAREAGPAEPLLAAAARAGRAATREAVATFWTRAHEDGLLPADCDVRWLADTTSVLAHAETYQLMRQTLRMTPKRYEDWLATTWRRMAAAATQT